VSRSAQPDGSYVVAWRGQGTRGHGAALSREEAQQVRQTWARNGYDAHVVPCDQNTEPSKAEEVDSAGCALFIAAGVAAGVCGIAGVVAALC
jgi:hypothetical protein